MSNTLSRKIDSSLASRVLMRIAIRVAIVILIMTAIAYYHVVSTVKQQSLGQLEKYIIERTQRERVIFKLAEDNHVQLKKELLERLQLLGDNDPIQEFNKKVKAFPDGTMRSRLEGFDGTRESFVFVGKKVVVSAEQRRLIKIFLELGNEYGNAWHHRLQNVYFSTPDNIFTGFWPEVPDWAHSLPADINLADEEYIWAADQRHNPIRESIWTGLFYDAVSRTWMVSVATPVDIDGRQIATIGHDITLNELFERTVADHLEGAYNLIIRDDGRLIAHPDKMALIKEKKGYFDVNTSSDGHLKSIYHAIKDKQRESVIENKDFAEYLAVGRLEEPGWYFVTVYPRALVSTPAFETASIVLLLGALSLFIELLIFYSVLKKYISNPLKKFAGAVNQIAEGNLDVNLDNGRNDELGLLGRSFNHMANEIQHNDRKLRFTVDMSNAMTRALSTYVSDQKSVNKIFNQMLEDILTMTESGYGFIGEIKQSDNKEFLKTHAITDISWDPASQKLYDEYKDKGLEFHNLDNLFGAAIVGRTVVISNDPANDERSTGLPNGHPPLNAYMGVPLFMGDEMIGMVGVANRPQGYDLDLFNLLTPLFHTCANVINAYRKHAQSTAMKETLEVEQQRLRETTQLLDNIVENVPNMIFLKNASDLSFKYLNRAAENVLGFDRNELLGRNDYDFFPKEQAEFFSSKDREVLARHEVVDIPEENIKTKNGTLILHTKKISLRDQNGKPQYLLGISEDITEQKRVEQKLRSQAEIIEQIHDAVVSTNIDGCITNWNKGAERLFGYSSEDILSQNINVICPEEEHEALRDDVIAPLRVKGNHDAEICLQRKSGEVFYGQLSLAMVLGENGDATGMIGYIRDVTDRKLAEEALIASEERIRLINSSVPGILFQLKVTVNGVRSLPYVSPTIEQYIGLSAEAAMADAADMFSLVHPGDFESLENSITESMENMTQWEWEGRFISKQENVTWLRGASTPVKSFDGSIIWNGVFIDVTEHRQAQQALQENETHLKKAQQISKLGHWKLNTQTREVCGSDELFQIFGLTREEATLNSFIDVIHPDDRARNVTIIKKSTELGEGWDIEYRLICPDGKEKWVHAIGEALIDDNGHVAELIGTVQDVTERAQVDAMFRALAECTSGFNFESFLSDVLEHLANLYDCKYAFVSKLSEDGERAKTLSVYANGEVADNFEYSLKGTPCQDILDKKKELIPRYASKIYPDDIELVNMSIESYFGAPLMTTDGVIFGILALMDTKEMKLDDWTAPVLGVFAKRISLEYERDFATKALQKHQEQLEELVQQRTADMQAARDEAQRANAAKSEFLSRMSHELRTPMNAILGFSQLLELDKNKLNQDQNENVNEIIDAGHHLLVLIDEVLDLAKIESGKLEISLEDVFVDDILKQSLVLIDSQARANKIKVVDLVTGNGLFVKADPTRLKQVFLNLLSNAVKYNCENGQIKIECDNIDDQRLRISISDTGLGLSNDAIAKLFTPFERLDADNTIEGTGIGLVITKRLVEKMNGTIGVESSQDRGSTFWIELIKPHIVNESIQQYAADK